MEIYAHMSRTKFPFPSREFSGFSERTSPGQASRAIAKQGSTDGMRILPDKPYTLIFR